MIKAVHPASPDNEGRRLLAEYETVTHFYSWAVGELSRHRGLLPVEQYNTLQEMVANALLECEMARLALHEFQA